MPSKLRKALGAVKDQTSISLAKVSGTGFANLDVAILKATSHDDVPVEERFVTEVVLLTSTSRSHAAACVRYLGRRISRTKNWVVALKSLNLVFRILQEGDPHFCHEVLRAIKRGSCSLLDLSNFRDDSNSSSPWDFTAFVRSYALYLAERLECSLMGKLQYRSRTKRNYSFIHHSSSSQRIRHSCSSSNNAAAAAEMKPVLMLDRIIYWQRLLDRVLAAKPTGSARTNRMVQISLYLVVRESFEIYRNISDALALVLDNFFRLPKHACVDAFHTCSKASKQFHDLGEYYSFCKSLGVGRASEYPSVQKISDTLLDTLNEFLKDSTHPSHFRPVQYSSLGGKPGPAVHLFHQTSSGNISSTTSSAGEVLLEEEEEEEGTEVDYRSTHPSEDDGEEDDEAKEDMTRTSVSSSTTTNQEAGGSVQDLTALDDEQQQQQQQGAAAVSPSSSSTHGDHFESKDCSAGWEMVLVESANNLAYKLNSINHRMFDPSFLETLFENGSPFNQNNPFLQNLDAGVLDPVANNDKYCFSPELSPLSLQSPFPAPPTFCANNPDVSTLPPEADPFSSSYCGPTQAGVEKVSSSSVNQDLMFRNHPQFSVQHHVR